MTSKERQWDVEPMAGWREFQAARQRVADLMWVDSQLREVVRAARDGDPQAASRVCELHDATD